MERTEEMALRRLQRLVNAETDRARGLYTKGIEGCPPTDGMMTLLESLGKVARCFAKLDLAIDREVADHWQRELKDEMVKCNSILDRLYLRFVEEG